MKTPNTPYHNLSRNHIYDQTDGIHSKQDVIGVMKYFGILDTALRHIDKDDSLRAIGLGMTVSIDVDFVPNAPGYEHTIQSGIRFTYLRKPGDFQDDEMRTLVVPVRCENGDMVTPGVGFTKTQAELMGELTKHWLRLELEDIEQGRPITPISYP